MEPVLDHELADPGVGPLLRRFRTRLGVSQRWLAERSTVSVRAIRDIEHGCSARPRRETVRLMAEGLGLTQLERAELDAAAGRVATGADLRQRYAAEAISPPAPLEPLIGRAATLSALVGLLSAGGPRLVTLTGLTGVGKTRLALAAANALHTADGTAVLWTSAESPHPGDPVGWPLGSDQLSVALRARLAGLCADAPAAADALAEVIADQPTLLVLDGGAPGAPAGAQLGALLRACANLRVLITAHRPCGLAGERVVPLGPLTVPADETGADPAGVAAMPAVALLVDHARQARAEFRLSSANAAALAALARCVDGIPAALAALASWLGPYPPAELCELVTPAPLDFLAGAVAADGVRRLRDRLTAAVAALAPAERALLVRLAGRRGAWSVADAAGAAGLGPGACAPLVGALLAAGLVRADDRRDRARFQVLNLVRQPLAAA